MKKPAPGLVIASKYRLEKTLASGGMGSVWVARHIELDALVAIKFISEAESSEARARFQREAQAAARIRTPHVVHVTDYGVDDELPYIVMELLQGEDLNTRLKRMQRLSLEQTFEVLLQVSRALRRTHDQGIIHRDLKPGNIFIVAGSEDEGEIIKIVDFGIAKGTGPFLTDENTTTGSIMGSPSYMSPEQVRGLKDLDARSDLWSLGVILYRALTGRLPFVSDVQTDLLVQIATAPVPKPRSIARDLPASVDKFFDRALARDRAKRFQESREMVEAFAAIIGPTALRRLATSSMTGPPPADAVAARALVVANAGTAPGQGPREAATAESTVPTATAMVTQPRSPILASRGNRIALGALVFALSGLGGFFFYQRFVRPNSDAHASTETAASSSPSASASASPSVAQALSAATASSASTSALAASTAPPVASPGPSTALTGTAAPPSSSAGAPTTRPGQTGGKPSQSGPTPPSGNGGPTITTPTTPQPTNTASAPPPGLPSSAPVPTESAKPPSPVPSSAPTTEPVEDDKYGFDPDKKG